MSGLSAVLDGYATIAYLETQLSKRLKFLRYIKRTFHPSFVYYPGCGGDVFPKRIFGKHHVIHLSLPEDEPEHSYLKNLGAGIKLLGHMEKSSLADASVDMIWLRIHGILLNATTIADFDRVLQSGGIIVVEGSGFTFAQRNRWKAHYNWFKAYEVISLPDEFKCEQHVFGVYKGDDTDGEYLDSQHAVENFVSNHKSYGGFHEILDYAVFRKP